jgi:DNA polymerase-3 subunit gamma/tau
VVAPHRALYRRWRAQTFSEIVGQEAVVTTLRNAVRTNRLAHGLLFVGPRGTGKTSLARIVAKAVNCPFVADGEPCDVCDSCVAIREGRALDVIEMDAASNNKVDDMRELLERTWTAPSDLARKVYIVDEVQRIKEGWDVLLKTLEEPPDHVVFIFCTTDASQIRPAVLSRVQRFDFTRLSVDQIAGKLDRILAADGRTAEPGAVQLVARLAAGGMRDAESILDQVLASGDELLTEAQVGELLGLVDSETVIGFLDALVRGDALAGLAAIDGLEERGRDLHVFLDQVVDAVRLALTSRLGNGPAATPASPESVSDTWPVAGLIDVARRLAAIDPSRASIGGLRFQLELALLEASPRPALAPPAR